MISPPIDKQVIFGSARNIPANDVRFYSPRLFLNLYTAPVSGGRNVLISAAGMENAHYNSKGSAIVFQDRKGYEDGWRKHHVSSVTRDIWIMDVANNTYRKISGFEGEDREPVFSPDDEYVYYLSEKNGNQNIFKTPVRNKMAEQQLTSLSKHPVRHLSVSKDNTLCFSYDGEIYTLKDGAQPQELKVQIFNDGRAGVEKNLSINGNVTEFSLSPNGKEIAFISRGEVFVTTVWRIHRPSGSPIPPSRSAWWNGTPMARASFMQLSATITGIFIPPASRGKTSPISMRPPS